jgi:hypothetical protein
MGYALHGFSGYTPLTYTEIYSYMKSTKTDLSPSEVNMLKQMSSSYVSQTHDKNPISPPPYIDDKYLEDAFSPKNSLVDKLSVFG